MIVSENWLRTLVKFSQGFEQLPALLTQAGNLKRVHPIHRFAP